MGYPPFAAEGMLKHTGCTRTCMIGIGPRHDHTHNLRAGSRGGPATTSTIEKQTTYRSMEAYQTRLALLAAV